MRNHNAAPICPAQPCGKPAAAAGQRDRTSQSKDTWQDPADTGRRSQVRACTHMLSQKQLHTLHPTPPSLLGSESCTRQYRALRWLCQGSSGFHPASRTPEVTVSGTFKDLPGTLCGRQLGHAPTCTQTPGAAFLNHGCKRAHTRSGCSQLWSIKTARKDQAFANQDGCWKTVSFALSWGWRTSSSWKENGLCGNISPQIIGTSVRDGHSSTRQQPQINPAPQPEVNSPPARRAHLSSPGMAGKAEDRGRCEGRTHTSSSLPSAGSKAATETETAAQTEGD